jgi:lysophospholipase L1-like esterase
MKPFRILLFLLSSFAVLLIISYVFPEDGIKINDKINLHFITPAEIFHRDTIVYKDISDILNPILTLYDSLPTADIINEENPEYQPDSAGIEQSDPALVVHRIEYPGNDSTILFPFFRQLKSLKTSDELIRILHYGDSQIEEDRMSSYIRARLQDRFGGSGIGLRPAVSLYGFQLSLRHYASDNWIRYTAFGNTDAELDHNRYGVLASFARFAPYSVGNIQSDSNPFRAWIQLVETGKSKSLSGKYSQCRIYYGNCTEPVMFELYMNGLLYDADFLLPSTGVRKQSWHFSRPPSDLKIEFTGYQSPDFYCIALDAERGIALDNIPMRGSSGLIFTRIDQSLLKDMLSDLNVKMILLQFGGNAVPYISGNYAWYEKRFTSQLTMLKKICPGVSIIVIGVSDMSIKEKNKIVSYPNLENIRDALKNATFNAGCAYWDMYEAMGGANSMPAWVNAEPPLAAADFVHFNSRGARIIAEMFYNSFINEYDNYLEVMEHQAISSR